MRRALMIVGIVLSAVSEVATAQQPPAPRFEAASIRPGKSDLTYPSVQGRSPGRYAIDNASLVDLIRQAYSLPPFAIVGGPEWARRVRFDVVAVAPGSSFSQHRSMLQTLLAERFALQVHRETRQQPVYELVKARSDGRLGPNLKPSTADCSQVRCYEDSGVSSLRAVSIAWSQVLANFSANLDRPVIDKSTLKGSFDIEFRWAEESLDVSDHRPEQVVLFTALQEQLGLKLQRAVGPVEVLVLDSVQMPTPN
jgi:uncharacterized protein (TIGR03435 family)